MHVPIVGVIILVVPNTHNIDSDYKGYSLLNCEALPGSEVSVLYSLDCKMMQLGLLARIHKIMPIMLAL